MKVLHINFSENKGGAAKIMQGIINGTSDNVSATVLASRCIDYNVNFIGYKFLGSELFYKLHHKISVYYNRFFNDTTGIISRLYLSKIKKQNPDIVHLHNIHGGWFNLKLVVEIAKLYPIVWTMHDEWLYTGHCTSTFSCPKFKTGCGNCPDLKCGHEIYFDNTKENWCSRKKILDKLLDFNVSIVCVSHWLKDKLDNSKISRIGSTVIYNGINLNKFYYEDSLSFKLNLGFEKNDKVIVASAVGGIQNKTKNLKLIIDCIKLINNTNNTNIKLLLIGGDIDNELDNNFIKQTGYIDNIDFLRKCYSLSDLMVYTTLNDTFGLVVAECLACGTPVLASKIGGVQELLTADYLFSPSISTKDLSDKIIAFLKKNHKHTHEFLYTNIKTNFSSEKMSENYLKLYNKIKTNE